MCLFCEDHTCIFDLIAPLSNFWHIILLVIVTALVASSVNSLRIAIASVISINVIHLGVSDRAACWINRIIFISINIPAVILSVYRFDVTGLFHLVCATSVLPVFLGMITKDHLHSCANMAGCIRRDFVWHCCSFRLT